MSILNAAKAFFSNLKSEAPKADGIEHSSYTGSRFVLLLVLLAGVLYVTKGVLTESTLWLCFWGYVTYTASNTVTRAVQMWVNGRILLKAQELAYADGKLDEVEAKSLSDRHASVK